MSFIIQYTHSAVDSNTVQWPTWIYDAFKLNEPLIYTYFTVNKQGNAWNCKANWWLTSKRLVDRLRWTDKWVNNVIMWYNIVYHESKMCQYIITVSLYSKSLHKELVLQRDFSVLRSQTWIWSSVLRLFCKLLIIQLQFQAQTNRYGYR